MLQVRCALGKLGYGTASLVVTVVAASLPCCPVVPYCCRVMPRPVLSYVGGKPVPSSSSSSRSVFKQHPSGSLVYVLTDKATHLL